MLKISRQLIFTYNESVLLSQSIIELFVVKRTIFNAKLTVKVSNVIVLENLEAVLRKLQK